MRGGGLGGFGAEVNMRVVSITVEVHGEVPDHLTKGEELNDEEEVGRAHVTIYYLVIFQRDKVS